MDGGNRAGHSRLVKTAGPGSDAAGLPKKILEAVEGLEEFAGTVFTGEAGVVGGVFVPGLFAYSVIQQPDRKDTYVSGSARLVTQFRRAQETGVTALLAHNYLAGRDFSLLSPGQEVWLVNADGRTRRYVVTGLFRYQKLDPSTAYSDLVDLETGDQVTSTEVYGRFYRGSDRLVFQTCLEGDGKLDWGLVFIVAEPAGNPLQRP